MLLYLAFFAVLFYVYKQIKKMDSQPIRIVLYVGWTLFMSWVLGAYQSYSRQAVRSRIYEQGAAHFFPPSPAASKNNTIQSLPQAKDQPQPLGRSNNAQKFEVAKHPSRSVIKNGDETHTVTIGDRDILIPNPDGFPGTKATKMTGSILRFVRDEKERTALRGMLYASTRRDVCLIPDYEFKSVNAKAFAEEQQKTKSDMISMQLKEDFESKVRNPQGTTVTLKGRLKGTFDSFIEDVSGGHFFYRGQIEVINGPKFDLLVCFSLIYIKDKILALNSWNAYELNKSEMEEFKDSVVKWAESIHKKNKAKDVTVTGPPPIPELVP